MCNFRVPTADCFIYGCDSAQCTYTHLDYVQCTEHWVLLKEPHKLWERSYLGKCQHSVGDHFTSFVLTDPPTARIDVIDDIEDEDIKCVEDWEFAEEPHKQWNRTHDGPCDHSAGDTVNTYVMVDTSSGTIEEITDEDYSKDTIGFSLQKGIVCFFIRFCCCIPFLSAFRFTRAAPKRETKMI